MKKYTFLFLLLIVTDFGAIGFECYSSHPSFGMVRLYALFGLAFTSCACIGVGEYRKAGG